MGVVGYYVDLKGDVLTVTESEGKLLNTLGDEVLIQQGIVLTGFYEEGVGFRVDEEYHLHPNLDALL